MLFIKMLKKIWAVVLFQVKSRTRTVFKMKYIAGYFIDQTAQTGVRYKPFEKGRNPI